MASARARAGTGTRLEGLTLRLRRAEHTCTLAEINGEGTVQADVDRRSAAGQDAVLHPPLLWDSEPSPRWSCRWATSSPAGGASPRSARCAVCVNPGSGLSCYWTMPFRKGEDHDPGPRRPAFDYFGYQVNYVLAKVPRNAAYFHAQFRRVHKLPYKGVYTILDGVRGRGQYVGTYLAWERPQPGLVGRGRGQVLSRRRQRLPHHLRHRHGGLLLRGPTTSGNPQTHRYQTFTTPYTGLAQVLPPDRIYVPGQPFGLYRWHIPNPVRFQKDLKLTIQALGWQSGGRYLPLEDDIASVAYWYQTEPHAKFPPLPDKAALAIKPISVAPLAPPGGKTNK